MQSFAPFAARPAPTGPATPARWALVMVVALLASVALSVAPPAGAAPPSAGNSGLSLGDHGGQVSARMFADVAAVGPGNRFQVGIEITMASGWHTYWENGGDAGLATSIDWTLPEGFNASPIRWPAPHRYEEDGDIVTFGYADRTVLLVDITAPAPLPEGPLRFGAVVDWLQCKDICIPGSAELDLLLEAADARVPAPDPVLRKFEAARKQLPRPVSSYPDIGIQAFQDHDAFPVGTTGEVAVVFAGLGGITPENCEFFPRPSDELWMRDGTFRSDGDNLALIIPVEVDTEVAAGSVVTLPAVVRILRNGEELLLSFEVPVTVA
ncbi:MAG: hypothetical protein HKN12_09570, partial [Gemmatimonadetes bacterium]|nr:hypothetical protein [Gemmatimonadota bacterium]